MTDVFVSYSRKDQNFARRVTDALSKKDQDVWVDWEDIPLTADWWEEIQRGIEATNTFIFIMSEASLMSPVCAMEVEYAINHQKRIVPVVHEECDLDSLIEQIDSLELDEVLLSRLEGRKLTEISRNNFVELSHLNWVFFRDEDQFDDSFVRLMEAVRLDLDYVRRHTRYYTRAREWLVRDKPVDLLLLGDEITSAEEWLAQSENKVPPLTPLHHAYVEQSRMMETKRLRLLRNLRIASILLGIIGVAALIATAMALVQTQRTNEQLGTATAAQGFALEREQTAVFRSELANTQIFVANSTLTPIAWELRTARDEISNVQLQLQNARTNVSESNATLTPIPVTLTAVSQQVLVVREQLIIATISQGQALDGRATARAEAGAVQTEIAEITILLTQISSKEETTGGAIPQGDVGDSAPNLPSGGLFRNITPTPPSTQTSVND